MCKGLDLHISEKENLGWDFFVNYLAVTIEVDSPYSVQLKGQPFLICIPWEDKQKGLSD